MEKESFRVETDYGIALVRKDKVARIDVTPKADKAPDKSASQPVIKPAPEKAVVPERAAEKPTPPPPPRKPPTIQERKIPGGKIEEHVDGSTYFNDTFGFQ